MNVAGSGARLDRDLMDIVGAAHVRPADVRDEIDGIRPHWVVAPGSISEAAAVLRVASREGLALAPRGGGTAMGLGNPPSRLDVVLETGRMNRVLAHEAGDLIVEAEAGASLEDLQTIVRGSGQMLAIDSPHPHATLGGMVAANTSGARRFRYGTLRDLVIGLTIVLPDGTVARSGGRVVKNVAGYDLGKLFTGSLGTLGLISQIIFRLHAVPPARALVEIDVDSIQAVGDVVQVLLHSPLVPSAIELSGPATQRRINVLFEGTEAGVTEQAQRACNLTAISGRPSIAESAEDDLEPGGAGPAARVAIKITCLPADVPATLTLIDAVTEKKGVDVEVWGQAATAVLWVRLYGEMNQIAAVILRLREAMAPGGGSVVVTEAPVDLKRLVDVWGPAGDALPLMWRMKERFDPLNVMNPGRFVGGI